MVVVSNNLISEVYHELEGVNVDLALGGSNNQSLELSNVFSIDDPTDILDA